MYNVLKVLFIMKKYIKFPDEVIEIVYNQKTRLITRKTYLSSHPDVVFIDEGFADEPLDMFFQSDEDLLRDVNFYTSSSELEAKWLSRPKFFGKNGNKLKLYYEL